MRRSCVKSFREARQLARSAECVWLPPVLETLRKRFPAIKISRSRLFAWERAYNRPADIVKLIDSRGGNRRNVDSVEAWKAFRDLYLDQRQPALKRCWQAVMALAKESGWRWCGLRSCELQLNVRIPIETQLYHREPHRHRTTLRPFIAQNPESWSAGECWVGDHKQLDLWCAFNGSIIRPWLTTWIDWRTRRLTGWTLSDSPNSTTTLAALRHGLVDSRNHGGPADVWDRQWERL